jgi:hypothetical protein
MERMERKKRSGKLAVTNGNPLGALDDFIKDQAEANKPIQPGEFSIYDYIEKMKEKDLKININTAIRTMNNLIETGVVASRKALKNSKKMNFYRFL